MSAARGAPHGWITAAMLGVFTSSCNLNPTPEDPGINDSSPVSAPDDRGGLFDPSPGPESAGAIDPNDVLDTPVGDPVHGSGPTNQAPTSSPTSAEPELPAVPGDPSLTPAPAGTSPEPVSPSTPETNDTEGRTELEDGGLEDAGDAGTDDANDDYAEVSPDAEGADPAAEGAR